ncbi:hypothetical protein ACFT2C_06190 [Promicromonospora sp. NPDC057138]|uniref:hypothetical protein n=1 Tax=Promicromonospora sp. NPDC057138 TaxID=3346031 RepID=UPI0036456F68
MDAREPATEPVDPLVSLAVPNVDGYLATGSFTKSSCAAVSPCNHGGSMCGRAAPGELTRAVDRLEAATFGEESDNEDWWSKPPAAGGQRMTDGGAAHGGADGPTRAGFSDCAARWAVQQCEPLVPGAARLATEARFVELTQESPGRTASWFGGVLADQIGTLPPDDPWRNLSARVGDLTRGAAPPAGDGAVSPAGPFGAMADGVDLVPTTFPSPMTDVGLAALSDGLSPIAAAVLAFATDGWSECNAALTAAHARITQSDGQVTSAACIVASGGDAVRWALWRRRVYSGPADDWFLASAFSWLWRAEYLAAEGTLPADELADIDGALQDEAIDPTAYRVTVEAVSGKAGPEPHA